MPDDSPTILNRRIEPTRPLEVNVRRVDKRIFHQDQVSLDKIVSDSSSQFYITGKTTKINLVNFIQLISKHQIGEVEALHQEDVVVNADLLTRIANASSVDEDEEELRRVDSSVIGIFLATFILSLFALIAARLEDVKSVAIILLIISAFFVGNAVYKGYKSGEIKKLWRVLMKSLVRK